LNGAIYLAYWNYLKQERSFFGDKTFAYIMPRERSIDIDEEIDFILAELLMCHPEVLNEKIRNKKEE